MGNIIVTKTRNRVSISVFCLPSRFRVVFGHPIYTNHLGFFASISVFRKNEGRCALAYIGMQTQWRAESGGGDTLTLQVAPLRPAMRQPPLPRCPRMRQDAANTRLSTAESAQRSQHRAAWIPVLKHTSPSRFASRFHLGLHLGLPARIGPRAAPRPKKKTTSHSGN